MELRGHPFAELRADATMVATNAPPDADAKRGRPTATPKNDKNETTRARLAPCAGYLVKSSGSDLLSQAVTH